MMDDAVIFLLLVRPVPDQDAAYDGRRCYMQGFCPGGCPARKVPGRRCFDASSRLIPSSQLRELL